MNTWHRILPILAKPTKTPLSNLVAELADALLNYSKVHHRLCLRSSNQNPHRNEEDENDSSFLQLQQLLSKDALHVVHFIKRANPQLKQELMHRKFIPSHYFAYNTTNSDMEGGVVIPMHPMVVNVRARRLTNDGMPGAAKLCRTHPQRLHGNWGFDQEALLAIVVWEDACGRCLVWGWLE